MVGQKRYLFNQNSAPIKNISSSAKIWKCQGSILQNLTQFYLILQSQFLCRCQKLSPQSNICGPGLEPTLMGLYQGRPLLCCQIIYQDGSGIFTTFHGTLLEQALAVLSNNILGLKWHIHSLTIVHVNYNRKRFNSTSPE